MPTASNGFIAATSRNPGSATTRPSRGTCSSRSLITVMSTLSVSSGTRLSSSTYSSDAVAHRRDQRAVDEHVGVVALGEHPRRVEVADEAGRRQLGVALDELEADAELVGDGAQQRRLAGARRALDERRAGRRRARRARARARAGDRRRRPLSRRRARPSSLRRAGHRDQS